MQSGEGILNDSSIDVFCELVEEKEGRRRDKNEKSARRFRLFRLFSWLVLIFSPDRIGVLFREDRKAAQSSVQLSGRAVTFRSRRVSPFKPSFWQHSPSLAVEFPDDVAVAF